MQRVFILLAFCLAYVQAQSGISNSIKDTKNFNETLDVLLQENDLTEE